MYKRLYLEIVKKRLNEQRMFIQVLMGPRQVGKTTLIRQLTEEIKLPYLFESADAVAASDGAWIVQLWESVRIKMKAQPSREFLLIIDEIQKIHNWSEVVKQQWDRDTRESINIKVILLGSSRLLLQQGLTESLAGRFELIHMGHWSYIEMKEAFGWNIDQYMYYGGYPGSAQLIDDEYRWKEYINNSLIESSISKDILMLTRVDKPALLKRLFEIGSLYSGQILSYTKIVGQLQDAGNTTTLAGYLKLLSDSCLLTGIEKYAGDIIRKRSSIPKFQVYNNALLSAQSELQYEYIRSNPSAWGRFAESSVGAHLINHAIMEKYQVYYWRENNKEVDFILEKNNKLVAIEVKSGAKQINDGMAAFCKQYQPVHSILVGTGGLAFEEFLSINPNELFT